MAFTVSKNKDKLEERYERISKEEIPMASFIEIEGNEKFLKYIEEYTQ